MSQSPLTATKVGIDRYKQGWKSLNRFLHEDRSFSGHERNSAFLNLGNRRFADLSAASGFGFFDDARAVATFDWDFDGDLDFWIANRTAPRIRFLKNNNTGRNHYLALRLVGNGKTTNIDGIGARVEVVIKTGPDKITLIKTLYGGNGFLSQSSKWLHFGLGAADVIESLVIHWPGGARQVVRAVNLDRHYLVSQTTGKLTVFKKPAGERVDSRSVLELPVSGEAARIVLPSRLPLPALTYETWEGDPVSMAGAQPSPLLVNIWASWCLPCWQEFAQWTEEADAIKASGLRIVGLNVDEVNSNSDKNHDPRPRLTKMGFPFETGRGDRVLLNTLDAFQRATLDRWRPLPVPTSVLVDELGRVAVIYRGPVEVAQLLADVKLLKASPEALREAAVPFAGQWFDPVPVANPSTVSAQFIDLSMIGHAYRYLLGYADQFAGLELSPGERRRVGDAYFTAAVLLKEKSAFARAAETLQKGVAANPDDLRIRALLGELQWRQGNLDETALHYGVVLKARPSDFATLRKLALVYLKQKKYAAALPLLARVTRAQPGNAVAHVNTASAWLGLKDHGKAVASYRTTLKIAPRMPKALNNLAWILATHPDPEIRSGAEAVTVAERLCELSKYTSPVSLDTLAAAYAEAGRFAEALVTSKKAIGLLPSSAEAVQVRDMKRRREGYQQKKPYRDR